MSRKSLSMNEMACRPYPGGGIPDFRKSVGEVSSTGSSRKRKVSTLVEADTLGSLQRNKRFASGVIRTKKNKSFHAEGHDEEKYSFVTAASRARKKSRIEEPLEEERLQWFRRRAPQSYLDRLERVRSQRMFLIDRQRIFNLESGNEEELFDIAGSTGNIYQVTIGRIPSCTCPDAEKGNQCKHIVYVLVNVLKAPEHLAYQVAFLSSELSTIFAQSPASPQTSSSQKGSSMKSAPNNRKPIEGECPVCVMEFEAETEEIVWCRAGCGNNIHKQCFERWAASKPGQAKCVYCRTLWKCGKGDQVSLKRIIKTGKRNEEGYVNVAAELGLSGVRDESTYYRSWGRDEMYGDWPY